MTNQHPKNDTTFLQSLPSDCDIGSDAAQQKLFREYGAVFVARGGVAAPNKVVFRDERDVAAFQSQLDIAQRTIGEHSMELQASAMDKLLEAIAAAAAEGLWITPRGADSARRNYNDTIDLWNSRVEPALIHWVKQGKMTREQADSIRGLNAFDQVAEVFALEENGIFFAKDLSKSIIYSVAPPGASQHLSLLAFDVAEHNDARIREILTRHLWYQTVVSDLPHFTFLGVSEGELPGLGLKKVARGEREFWIPDI